MTGTYIGIYFTDKSNNVLNAIRNSMGVLSNDPHKDTFHTTIAYSKNTKIDVESFKKEASKYIGTKVIVKGIPGIWMDHKNRPILVLKLTSCPLFKSLHQLTKSLGATSDYPTFKPHITLDYEYKHSNIILSRKITFELTIDRFEIEDIIEE